MLELHGKCHGTTVLLHGGAGGQDPKSPDALMKASVALKQYGKEAFDLIAAGRDPFDAVIHALKSMEDDPQFNAGIGSALQADGQTRLTAAVMDGRDQRFSGVISCSYVRNPCLIARHLQTMDSRVVTNPGAELIARQLGLGVDHNFTAERAAKWTQKAFAASCDTVGCVVRTVDGGIIVGTSTGGRGHEFPGRVSDSATVAGTYSSKYSGISATGVGEEIVDDAVAARIDTRRRDGLSLKDASAKTFAEAVERKRQYGWIALDLEGYWSVAHTTPAMSYAVYGDGGNLVAGSS